MKNIISSIVIVLLLTTFAFATEKDQQAQPQKYDITITIEYHAVDLKLIAEKESAIKKVLGDASKIDISFKKDCPSCNTNRWSYTYPQLTN